MDNNSRDHGAKPRAQTSKHNQQGSQGRGRQRIVRKPPPRVVNDDHNIYITSKSPFKAQLKRCQQLLDSGAKEIFLHCMGYAITRGLNLALRLITNSDGALSYAINTSTLRLVDELHPLCDEDDIDFRQRDNSALHIKIYNNSLFDIVVPELPVKPAPTLAYNNREDTYARQQQQRKAPQQQQKKETQSQKKKPEARVQK